MQIHNIGSLLFYTTVFVGLLDNNTSPTIAQYISWSAAVPVELAISKASLSINLYLASPKIGYLRNWRRPVLEKICVRENIELTLNGVRIATLLALVILYASKCTLQPHDRAASQLVNSACTATEPLASGRLGGASSDTWWRSSKGLQGL